MNKPNDESISNQGSPNTAPTKPNDSTASQNELSPEFLDILNNKQKEQGDGNKVQVPNQPSIVQGGGENIPQPSIVQGGGDNIPQPSIVQGGPTTTIASIIDPTIAPTIAPTLAPTPAPFDPDEAGAEFGLDVNMSVNYLLMLN